MAFVEAGGYEIQQRSEGQRTLYRFAKPATDGYPAMLELFSNVPDGFELAPGSHLTPIPIAEDAASLSAILLDADYRSEEGRGGKAGCSTCCSRWSPYTYKKKHI